MNIKSTSFEPAMAQRNLRLSGSKHQRGAIAFLSIFVIFLVFAFFAISVDTGRLWMERRNLQKIADMAALTSARFTGCGGSNALVRDAARRAAIDNGLSAAALDSGDATVVATHGNVIVNSSNAQIYQLVAAESDDVRATQVSVTKKVPKSLVLGGWFITEKIELSARATAAGGPPIAAYTMGGSIFKIDNDFTKGFNSLIDTITGRNPSTNATQLQKLSASTVSLEDLRKAGGFKTIDDMLSSNMTIGQLLTIYSTAAASTPGGGDPQVKQAMSQLLSTIGTNGMTLRLADVLSLNTGNKDALLDVKISLLDLISTSVTVAGKNATTSFNLKTNIGGILGLKLEIGDVPQIAVGPGGRSAVTSNWCTGSKSTQGKISFGLGGGPLDTLFNLVSLGGLLIQPKIDFKFSLNFGNAEAHVKYIEPTTGTAKVHFGVNTSPFTMTITNQAETDDSFIGVIALRQKYGVALGTNNNKPIIDSPVDGETPTPVVPIRFSGSSETQGALAGMLSSIPLPRIVMGDPKTLGIFIAPVNLLIQGIFGFLTTFINSTLGELLGNTIDPILRAMGIYLGSADISLYDIQMIPPQLVSVKAQ